MQPVYTVHPIRRSEIDRAFPLVGPHLPEFDLAAWRAFCADPGSAGNKPAPEILVATGPGDYLRGLSIVAIAPGEGGQGIAEVLVLALGSVADEAGVAKELVGRVAELARERGCAGCRLWGGQHERWAGLLGAVAIAPGSSQPPPLPHPR